jgi:hypothetical protein
MLELFSFLDYLGVALCLRLNRKVHLHCRKVFYQP